MGKWKKWPWGKKKKKGRRKKGKKRKRGKGGKEEKEEKRKKGGKPKKFLFKLNKGEKIWNLPFFFPIKPWKWPRGKKGWNRGK